MIRYLVAFALFYFLTPGVLLTIPRGGSKTTVALTHAAVFVLLYYLAEYLAELFGAKDIEFDFDDLDDVVDVVDVPDVVDVVDVADVETDGFRGWA